MPDELDWLMAPVLRGMCRMTDLKDGSLTLGDVAIMNDAISVEAENRRRANG